MVPVTDVDRAKEFYEKVGFVVDHDQVVSDDVRFVQLTPPGSACSIAIGKGLTQMEPGSLDNMQMVVADADATHADLVARGIEVSEVDELAVGPLRLLRRPRRQRLGAPAAARLVGGRRRRGLSPAAGSPGVGRRHSGRRIAGRCPAAALPRSEQGRVGRARRSGVDGGAASWSAATCSEHGATSVSASRARCSDSACTPSGESLAPRPTVRAASRRAASTMLVGLPRAERTSASASWPGLRRAISARLGPGVGAPLVGVAGSHLQQSCGRGRTLPRHHDLP